MMGFSIYKFSLISYFHCIIRLTVKISGIFLNQKIDWLIDWLDSVLRRIDNISAM